MNLLFVYTSQIIPQNGGVQRVSHVLADFFKENNFNVFFLSLKKTKNECIENHYFFPEKNEKSIKNLNYIKSFVLEKKVNCIINQAALGGGMSALCYEAKKVSNVKIFSVIHNSLLANVDNFTSSNKKLFNLIPVSMFSNFFDNRLVKKLLLFIYLNKYKDKYQKMYSFSDKVILLSTNYFYQFKLFVSEASEDKVISIYNPCTIIESNSNMHKENELLYVGRINITQKRVDLLLDIWQKIFLDFPDWKLNIVGDGDGLNYLKKKSKEMKLERIFFVGHSNPIPYYKKAKFFCMTSSYEGLPLVLAEAQYFNVFPILFDSFPSASDVIANNENGILIEPFDIKSYVSSLKKLMINYDKNFKTYNLKLQKNVSRFSLDEIGKLWLELFDNNG